MNTTIEYKDENEAWEAGNKWIKQTNKWEKLQYLRDTCSTEFLQQKLLEEVMEYLYEYQFNELFEHLRNNWDIKTPQELDYITRIID
jgi:hypothetical protein